MTQTGLGRAGRQSGTLRRLSFWLAFPLLIGSSSWARAQAASPESRILERRVRVGRDVSGDYSIVEALLLRAGVSAAGPVTPAGPMTLLRLPDAASRVETWSEGLGEGRLSHEPPYLLLLGGPSASPVLRILIRYRLPRTTAWLELQAALPVDRLVLEAAPGSVESRPGPGLRRQAEAGEVSPSEVRYLADSVAAASALRLRLLDRRVDARQRLAVLLAVAALAGLAGVRLWHRRSGSP